MVFATWQALFFMPPDRDLLLSFSRGVRILYTPAKVDIHPRTPLGGKIKKYYAVKKIVVFTIFICPRYNFFGCLYDFGSSNSIFY